MTSDLLRPDAGQCHDRRLGIDFEQAITSETASGMSDAPLDHLGVDAGLRVIGALHVYDLECQKLRYRLRAFNSTEPLRELLDAAGESTNERLAVLESKTADRLIKARLKELGAEADGAFTQVGEALDAFRPLEASVLEGAKFRAEIVRWFDEIKADQDAVHGAARRGNCRRRAESCLGIKPPVHKRPRYSRLPKSEPDADSEARDSRLAQIHYTDGHVAAYAERYDSAQTVARGNRLARPYIYADDGITVLCPACRGEGMAPRHEHLVINTRQEHAPLVAALGDGLTLAEFLDHAAYTWHCADCGRWVVQQEIVGEEYRYCLQLVGGLGSYEDPDEELCKALVDRLAWARLRLRDLDPAEFETLAAGFLRRTLGPCDVHVVGQGSGRRDGGVDLVLVRADDEYLVQVKHHPQLLNGKVNESVLPIISLHGVMFREQIARGVFVTAADGYSRSVRSETQQVSRAVPGYDLQLYDRMDLSAWVRDVAAEDGPPWLPFMRSGRWTKVSASTWATPESLARAYPNATIITPTDLK